MKSDRNAKQDLAPVDTDDILRTVAQLPVERWSYRSEPGVRHIGPMAQDFHATLGVGADDRTIRGGDGEALRSMQAFHAHALAGALELAGVAAGFFMVFRAGGSELALRKESGVTLRRGKRVIAEVPWTGRSGYRISEVRGGLDAAELCGLEQREGNGGDLRASA